MQSWDKILGSVCQQADELLNSPQSSHLLRPIEQCFEVIENSKQFNLLPLSLKQAKDELIKRRVTIQGPDCASSRDHLEQSSKRSSAPNSLTESTGAAPSLLSSAGSESSLIPCSPSSPVAEPDSSYAADTVFTANLETVTRVEIQPVSAQEIVAKGLSAELNPQKEPEMQTENMQTPIIEPRPVRYKPKMVSLMIHSKSVDVQPKPVPEPVPEPVQASEPEPQKVSGKVSQKVSRKVSQNISRKVSQKVSRKDSQKVPQTNFSYSSRLGRQRPTRVPVSRPEISQPPVTHDIAYTLDPRHAELMSQNEHIRQNQPRPNTPIRQRKLVVKKYPQTKNVLADKVPVQEVHNSPSGPPLPAYASTRPPLPTIVDGAIQNLPFYDFGISQRYMFKVSTTTTTSEDAETTQVSPPTPPPPSPPSPPIQNVLLPTHTVTTIGSQYLPRTINDDFRQASLESSNENVPRYSWNGFTEPESSLATTDELRRDKPATPYKLSMLGVRIGNEKKAKPPPSSAAKRMSTCSQVLNSNKLFELPVRTSSLQQIQNFLENI